MLLLKTSSDSVAVAPVVVVILFIAAVCTGGLQAITVFLHVTLHYRRHSAVGVSKAYCLLLPFIFINRFIGFSSFHNILLNSLT